MRIVLREPFAISNLVTSFATIGALKNKGAVASGRDTRDGCPRAGPAPNHCRDPQREETRPLAGWAIRGT